MFVSSVSRPGSPRRFFPALMGAIRRCFDSEYGCITAQEARHLPDRVSLRRCFYFALLHLGCLGVIWVGFSWTALAVAVGLYLVRMFAITGFYHRYFSHRTFQTSRVAQFLFAVLGNTSCQRGALWWASVHRHHHQHSDHEPDVHSPSLKGFLWSHIGWITSTRNYPTDYSRVRDLAKFPELVLLNRFDTLVPMLFAGALWITGWLIGRYAPGLGVNAWQMLVWGFFISTVALMHATFSINSLAHLFGSRRFKTGDDSRNSMALALLTLGEGWHNNHHRYAFSTRQGFYWWEIDITYYALKALSWTGLIWNLRAVPESVYEEARGAKAVS